MSWLSYGPLKGLSKFFDKKILAFNLARNFIRTFQLLCHYFARLVQQMRAIMTFEIHHLQHKLYLLPRKYQDHSLPISTLVQVFKQDFLQLNALLLLPQLISSSQLYLSITYLSEKDSLF